MHWTYCVVVPGYAKVMPAAVGGNVGNGAVAMFTDA